ncbi:MAG: HEAT repeat domain-containing protein [Planctomycetes bacterium]|nr:HEAT repeat domain-containing protein [Planctomycetota bacterium]
MKKGNSEKTTLDGTSAFASKGATLLGPDRPLYGSKAQAYRQTLQSFLQKLFSYMKSCRLYPPGHERPVKMKAVLMESISQALHNQEDLLIYIRADGISVNGEEFFKENRVVADIVPELTRRNVRSLTLKRGVTPEELETLAGLLLMDANALYDAGGLPTVLAGEALPHIEIKEFSYAENNATGKTSGPAASMNTEQSESNEDSSREKSPQPPQHDLSPEEKKRIQELLEHPSIAEKVADFRRLVGQFRSNTDFPMGADDLLVHMVRNLISFEVESGNIGETDADRMVLHALDQLLQRLFAEWENKEEYLRKDVLELIACKMIASPENLLWWLSHKTEGLDIGITPDHAEMIKVIFNRTCSGPRRIRFGKTEMKTLDSPLPSKEGQKTLPKKDAQKEIKPEHIVEGFENLQQELGGRKYVPDLSSIRTTHLEILLEMLRIEEQADARERILEETARFTGQVISMKAAGGRSVLCGIFERLNSRMEPKELAMVLHACDLTGEALQVYLQGDRRWHQTLIASAYNQQSRFADLLGSRVLESEEEPPLENLEDLLTPCQDALVSWLWNRTDLVTGRRAFKRAMDLIMKCRTPRVVPLIERMLRRAGQADRWTFIQVLGKIDTSPAIRVIRDQMADMDVSMRSTALAMLGQSKQSLAEEILLDMADRPYWPWHNVEERLMILFELGRCGGSRSIALLEKTAHRWYLLLLPGGGRIRRRAAEALEAARTKEKDHERYRGESDHES